MREVGLGALSPGATHPGRPRVWVARPAGGGHLATVRRLLAIAIAAALVGTSVASAAATYCPAMRAQALKHCCCPSGPSGGARLTCCTQNGEVSGPASSAREHTERFQVAPVLVAVLFAHPSADRTIAVIGPSRALHATSAGPPSVPLRV